MNFFLLLFLNFKILWFFTFYYSVSQWNPLFTNYFLIKKFCWYILATLQNMWDLSLTKDWTHAPCIGSLESQPLVCLQLLSFVWLFSDPMDCSPPGSSVRGILQARILKWVVISSSRGSSQSRDWTQVFCIKSRFFTTVPP